MLVAVKTPLSRALGKLIQDIREAQGTTQDAVARVARAAGVAWTASTVAALETGRRSLTIDEVVHLPEVLHRLGVPAPALDVHADADSITISLCGKPLRVMTSLKWEESFKQLRAGARAMKAFPHVTKDQMAAARIDEGGVLEQRLARRFKTDAVIVALAARARWGCSASEERDRRAAGAADSASARGAQTLRGHVTRQLIAELAPDLSRTSRRSGRGRSH